MINLIPPVAKKKIIIEYWARVSSVWLSILSAVLLIWSVSLLPAYVLITSQINVYSKDSAEVKAEVDEYNTAVKSLIDTSAKASLLLAQEEAVVLSEVIELLESLVVPGVRLESFEVIRDSATAVRPVVISGQALSRESLANFREALLKSPQIESALLPLSNLAKDRDIAFAITVSLKTIPK